MKMRWPKPEEAKEIGPNEDGSVSFTIDMTPHPSIIYNYAEARARDFLPEFVDECLRIHFLTNMCGLPLDEARKLAQGTHTLHIDADSDDEAYILTVVGDEEE